VKTSPKRSYSVIENERFGLVFAKTVSIISGTCLFEAWFPAYTCLTPLSSACLFTCLFNCPPALHIFSPSCQHVCLHVIFPVSMSVCISSFLSACLSSCHLSCQYICLHAAIVIEIAKKMSNVLAHLKHQGLVLPDCCRFPWASCTCSNTNYSLRIFHYFVLSLRYLYSVHNTLLVQGKKWSCVLFCGPKLKNKLGQKYERISYYE
jgi:hypothetical protein